MADLTPERRMECWLVQSAVHYLINEGGTAFRYYLQELGLDNAPEVG